MAKSIKPPKSIKPLVSIVTPSYNHGRFIEETIESVLSQDYPNIEYIVIDGASSDNTVGILKKYGDRLKWVSEKDKGAEDAINKGFAMSHGEILAWIASDDTYAPGAVSRAVGFLTSHKDVDMVYGRAYYIDKDGKVIYECQSEPFEFKKLAVEYFIFQPSVFFTRKAFYGAGELSLGMLFASDFDLWVRIGLKYKIEYLPEFLSNYRLHDDAKTMGARNNELRRYEEFIGITLKYYDWAPANRVYPYCLALVRARIPQVLSGFKPLVRFISVIAFFGKYLRLNKGIKMDDIRLLPRNLKKFFHGWELEDILNRNPKECSRCD